MGMCRKRHPIGASRAACRSVGPTATTSNPSSISARINPARNVTRFHAAFTVIMIFCFTLPEIPTRLGTSTHPTAGSANCAVRRDARPTSHGSVADPANLAVEFCLRREDSRPSPSGLPSAIVLEVSQTPFSGDRSALQERAGAGLGARPTCPARSGPFGAWAMRVQTLQLYGLVAVLGIQDSQP